MQTQIQKWGNSLAIRIPKEITNKMEIQEGSEVIVMKRNNSIIIKQTFHKKPSLKELVKKINPKNLHEETDWGKSYGKETW